MGENIPSWGYDSISSSPTSELALVAGAREPQSIYGSVRDANSFHVSSVNDKSFNAKAFMPNQMDALVLRERREVAGVYGIGIKIDTDPPHTVQRVHDLVDPGGRNINTKVNVGDILTFVDDAPIDKTSIDAVEQVIFGDFDTTVKISLSSKANGRLYELFVKRHVPIRTWEHVRRWYEVKEELVARGLTADLGIVDVLETIRLLVSDGTGHIKDLLNEGGRGKCTLGIQLAINSRNSNLSQRQVQGVILGSSAHVAGNLMRGDEIIMVDGEPATGENLQEKIRGNNFVGSRCVLTVDRQGKNFQVHLTRSPTSDVRNMERILDLLETHERMIRQGQIPGHTADALLSSLQMLLGQIINNERRRLKQEEKLATRLRNLQCSIFEQVTAAELMLHGYQPKAKSPPPAKPVVCLRCGTLEEDIASLRAELIEKSSLGVEYQVLSRRLAQLEQEKSLLGRQVAELGEGNAALTRKLEEQGQHKAVRTTLQTELESQLVKYAALQDKLDVSQGALRQSEQELASLRPEVGALREQLRLERAARAQIDERNDAGAQQIASLEEQLQQLSEKLRVETLNRKKAEEEVASNNKRWTIRLNESIAQTDTAKSELDRAQAEIRQLRFDIQAMVPKRDLDEKGEKERGFVETIARLQRDLAERSETINRHELLIQKLKSELAIKEGELVASDASRQEHLRAFESLNETHKQLQSTVRELRSALGGLQAEKAELSVLLERAKADFASEMALVQNAAERAREDLRGEIEHIHGEKSELASSLERIKAEYREQVAGLQSDKSDLLSAMEKLKMDLKGEISIKEEALRGSDASRTETQRNFETLSEAHRQLQQALREARAALQAAEGQREDALTGSERVIAQLRADLARREGELRAAETGRAEHQRAFEALSETHRQIQSSVRELRSQTTGMQAELAEKSTEIEDLRQQLEAAQPHAAAAPILRARGEALEQTVTEIKAKYDKVVGELRGQVAELEQRLEMIDGERISADAARAMFQKAVDQLNEGKRHLMRTNEELVAQLKHTEGMLEQKDHELAQAFQRNNELMQEIQNLQSLVELKDGEIRHVTRSAEDTAEHRHTLTRTIQEHVVKIHSLEVTIEKRSVEISEAHQNLENMAHTREKLQKMNQELTQQVKQLTFSVNTREEEVRQLEALLEEERGGKGALSKSNSDLNRLKQELIEKLRHTESLMGAKETEIRRLESQLENVGEAKRQLTKANSDLASQVAELSSLIEGKQGELRQHEKSLENLSEGKRQLSKSRDELLIQIQGLQEKIEGRNHDVAQLQEQVKALEESKRVLKKTITDHSKQIEGLHAEIEKKEEANRELQHTIENLTQGKAVASRSNQELLQKISGLEEALAKADEESMMLKSQADALAEGKRQLSKEKQELGNTIQELEEVITNMEQDRAGHGELAEKQKRQMVVLNDEKIQLSRTISELQLTINRLETRIESQDGELRKHVKSSESLNDAKRQQARSISELQAALGKVEGEYESLQLAHDTLLESKKQAAKANADLSAHNKSLDVSISIKEEEILRLQEEIARLEGLIRQADTVKGQLEARAQRAENQAREQAEQLQASLSERDNTISGLQEDIRTLQRESEGHRSRAFDIERLLKTITGERDSLQQEILSLTKDKQRELSALGQEKQREVTALSNDKEALAHAQSQLSQTVTQLQARIKELVAQLSAEKQLVLDLRGELVRVNTVRDEAEQEVVRLTQDLGALKSREGKLERELRQCETERSHAQEDKQALRGEVETLSHNNKRLSQQLAEAEGVAAQREGIIVQRDSVIVKREAELQDKERALQELMRELEASQQHWDREVGALRNRIAELEAELRAMDGDYNQRYNSQIRELEHTIKMRDVSITDLGIRLEQVTNEEADRTEELRNCKENVQELLKEREFLRKQIEECKEEIREVQYECEQWRTRAQDYERDLDALRDEMRVLREQLSAAVALSRDNALNIEIQQQQEQLIQSLKAQINQLERDASAATRALTERDHIDNQWQQERELYESRLAQLGASLQELRTGPKRRGIIGLQIEAARPFRVLNVTELMNEKGQIINDHVQIADELVEVDYTKVDILSVQDVFAKLGGPAETVVALRFRDHVTGAEYGIPVQRHLPIGSYANGSMSTSVHLSETYNQTLLQYSHSSHRSRGNSPVRTSAGRERINNDPSELRFV